MPSLLETFSANYPEAMKMNLPIICSDFNFSRDACGDAALYFDAQSPEDIADKIVALINNKTLQNDLINAGKKRLAQLETPESRANKILTMLENAALKNPKL
jgi:glycosyltransferase involved in cell wall biosynthesis